MNDMWLIDVEHYKKSLEGFKEKLLEFEKTEAVECVKTIIKFLKLEPKIDAVPVVRCKNCKYGEIDDMDFPYQYYCHEGCGWNDEDFWCAYGKRKTDEGKAD